MKKGVIKSVTFVYFPNSCILFSYVRHLSSAECHSSKINFRPPWKACTAAEQRQRRSRMRDAQCPDPSIPRAILLDLAPGPRLPRCIRHALPRSHVARPSVGVVPSSFGCAAVAAPRHQPVATDLWWLVIVNALIWMLFLRPPLFFSKLFRLV